MTSRILPLLLAAACGSSGSASPDAAQTTTADAAGATADAATTGGAPDAPVTTPDARLPDAAAALPDAASAQPDAAPAPPAAPALAACGGTHKVTLFATPVTGAASYRVYYATTPGVTHQTGTKVDASSLPVVIGSAKLTDDTTYHFVMTAVDAKGLESVDSAEVSATPRGRLQDLIVTGANDKVVITECFSLLEQGQIPAAQKAAVTRTIGDGASGLQGQTISLTGIYVDAENRRLYVGSFNPNTTTDAKVSVWENADAIDAGDDTPAAVLTGFDSPGGIAVDLPRSRLYVTDGSSSAAFAAVKIYKLPLTDGAQPYATIAGNATTLYFPNQLYLDQPGNRLYVANYNSTLVFNGPSAIAGAKNIAPTRTVTIANEVNHGVFVDTTRDLLYLSDATADAVYILSSASTVQGAQTPAAHGGADLAATAMLQVVNDTLYSSNALTAYTEVRAFASAHSLATTPTATYKVPFDRVRPFFVVP
jgi:hypothetical protein